MDNDMVVLVDTFDKVLGAMSKREAHTFTASAIPTVQFADSDEGQGTD